MWLKVVYFVLCFGLMSTASHQIVEKIEDIKEENNNEFFLTNETTTAEKMLFAPLSSSTSITTVSPILSELNSLYEYDPKSEVEDIQSGNKTQSNADLEEQFMNNDKLNPEIEGYEDDIVVDRPHLRHRDIVYIAAVMLTVICLFCYVGFVLWRKSVENRYGGLERLITEDDFSVNDNI